MVTFNPYAPAIMAGGFVHKYCCFEESDQQKTTRNQHEPTRHFWLVAIGHPKHITIVNEPTTPNNY